MAKQPKSDSAQTLITADPPGRVAQLRAAIGKRLPKWSRRTKIVLCVVVLLIVAHVAALVIWLPHYINPNPHNRFSMSMALAALDRHSLADARHIATLLQQSNHLESVDRGGPAFIFGVVAAAEAELLPETERHARYQLAVKFLQESQLRGFPSGRQAQGLFLLGQCLYLADNFTAARSVLEEAVQADPNLRRETDRLLANAYFNGADADFAKARQYSELELANPDLTPQQRDQAQLLNARILDKLSDLTGCKASLSQIPAQSPSYPAAMELEAELLMRQARAVREHAGEKTQPNTEAKSLDQQAIDKLKLVQSSGNSTAALVLRAQYLIGVCWLESGNVSAAQEQFQRVQISSAASQEGVAAVFQIADLLRREGRNPEALAMYRRVIQSIGDPVGYQNEFLPLDVVRQRLLSAYEQYLANSNFDEAVELARLLHPLFPRERELELSGELWRVAAKSYMSKASTAGPDQAKVLIAKARLNFRMAGLAFSKLAELHTTTRTYTDDLWNASECFSQGHDYVHATEALNLLLKNETRRRRAGALLMLGEAQLSLGETDKALAALQECTDVFSNDPAGYQARLLMAKAYVEKADAAKAEGLLRVNLEGGSLSPRSTEWRDSLFALGTLLENAGRYPEAIQRFEEAVTRYPTAPQAIEARYLSAECYRRIGQLEQQKMSADTIDASRIAHQKQMQQSFDAAVKQFQQLLSILSREKSIETTPLEKAICRNCYFALGMTFVDLHRFDDAIHVYSTIAGLYRNEPEVLEAFVQIAACYRKLNRPVEARGAVVQAQAALERLGKVADFSITTNYSREEWRQLLDRMAAL